LLRDAPVVLLDGADEGLAPAERDSVRRALKVLVAGRTTLLRSSEQETVLAADRAVCFESGVLVEDGPPMQLAADPDSWLSSWLLTTRRPARCPLRGCRTPPSRLVSTTATPRRHLRLPPCGRRPAPRAGGEERGRWCSGLEAPHRRLMVTSSPLAILLIV